jgi:hypothetical protein
MIGHHFLASAFCNAPRASGVCCSRGKTSLPRSASRDRTTGSASASAFQRAHDLADGVGGARCAGTRACRIPAMSAAAWQAQRQTDVSTSGVTGVERAGEIEPGEPGERSTASHSVRAAATEPMPMVRSAARPSMPAWWRAAPESRPASPARRSTASRSMPPLRLSIAIADREFDLLDTNLQRVARLRPVDEDRPGEHVPGGPQSLTSR